MSAPPSRRDWTDPALLGLAIVGVVGSLLLACLMLALGLAFLVQRDMEGALLAEWTAFGLGFLALAGAPALYWSGRAVFGFPPAEPSRPSRKWGLLALLLPLALVAGYGASTSGALSAVVGPVAQVGAASLPVALVVLGIRRVSPPVRPRRAWGQFLLGLWVAPVGALVGEVILLVPVLLMTMIALTASPEGRALLEALRNPSFPPDLFSETVSAVIVQPWAIGLALLYGAVIVPLVEEALKTMGTWPLLFSGRLSAPEAYLSGVLCGAGFALAEGLFLPQPGSLWVMGVLVRVAGTVVHSFTGGMSSWGLGESVRTRRAGPFLSRFLTAVGLHGLWNAAVLLIGVVVVAFEADVAGVSYSTANLVVIASACGLIVLLGISVIGLPAVARRVNRPAQAGAAAPSSIS